MSIEQADNLLADLAFVMQSTWASGAIELLRHADTHIKAKTAFDGRIAFISIDNSVETSVRTFLSLPHSRSGLNVTRKEIEAVGNSFPGLVELIWKHASDRLVGIDDADIEHYHRIRNKLYHEGTGLSVDEQHLMAYRQIAALLLNKLFGIDLEEPKPAATLEKLILLWNQIEKNWNNKLSIAGISRGHTFYPEEAMSKGVITTDEMNKMTKIRMIRNTQVHSLNVDQEEVEYAVHLADALLASFGKDASE